MATCTWKLEAYLSAAWVDISSEVLTRNSVNWSWGLGGGTPFDRTSRTGQMTFGLRNDDGAYSPGHGSATGGWQLGVPVKLTETFEGTDHVYRYYVTSINIVPGVYGERSVSVSCADWMDYPAKYPMTMTQLQLSKRADEALTTLAAAMPVSPQATSYEIGTNTFVSIFDTIDDKTRALSEISKLMNSELGSCILRKDKTNGEKLYFENSFHRNGLQELSNIPDPSSDTSFFLQENGDKLLQENGSSLLLDTCSHLSSVNTMNNAIIEYGRDITNFIEVKTTPRHVDTSLITLFSLRQPMAIGSGQTVTIKGKYTEPTSGRPINADPATMVTPTSSDGDYEAWTEFTGTGYGIKTGITSEFTNSLTITTSYGSDSFSHEVQNTSNLSGYITKFIQRGYGLYTWDEVSYQESSSNSQSEFGDFPKTFTQDYKNDMAYGTLFADNIVDANKEPRTVLKKVSFKSTTPELMLAFLTLDIGSIVAIKEDMSGIDGYYYINAVEASMTPTSVASEGFIEWTWILQQFYKINKGLSLYTVELTSDSENLAIDFGYIPELCNINRHSISGWIYPTADASSDSTDPSRVLVATYSDASGFDFVIKNEKKLGYNQVTATTSDVATFETSTDVVTLNQWNHVVVVRDGRNFTTAPLFYVDNVNKPTTTVTAQSLANATDTGSHTFLGNIKTSSWDYTGSFLGKMTNMRIYNNYCLTTDDINDLYNAGRTDYLTCIRPELEFWVPVIYTDRQADYIGSGIAPGKNVIDAVRYYVGKPSATAPSSGKIYTSQPDGTDGIDTYIAVAADTTNYGTANTMKIGSTGLPTAATCRGLLKFDLTKGTNPTDAGSTVVSATLTLTPVTDNSLNGRTLRLYRCKRNWSETQATWNEYSTGNNWQIAGAGGANDRENDIIGSVYVDAHEAVNTPIDITLDVTKVQEWVSGTFSNNGMILKVDTEAFDQFDWGASEGTAAYRPKLVINYV